MKLDSRQTRRFYLAGTIPFPKPFPSVGSISIEPGSLFYSARGPCGSEEDAGFVIVNESGCGCDSVRRVVLQADVGAIFFPGSMETTDGKEAYRFSNADRVEDCEAGEWFFTPDINVDAIVEKLKVKKEDIGGPTSIARGVIFVPEHRPVLTVREVTEPAGSAEPQRLGCECCCGGGCECKDGW